MAGRVKGSVKKRLLTKEENKKLNSFINQRRNCENEGGVIHTTRETPKYDYSGYITHDDSEIRKAFKQLRKRG